MLRRRKRMHDSPTEPELPIVPMLDMSFQLMAFFILTFKPTLPEGRLALLLPREGASGGPPPSMLEPKEEKKYYSTVYVKNTVVDVGFGTRAMKADTATELKALPHTANDKPFVANLIGGPIDTENLVAEMTKAVDEVKTLNKNRSPDDQLPPPKLEFLFDDDVPYQVVIRLVDDAKRAGFQKVTPMLWKEGKP